MFIQNYLALPAAIRPVSTFFSEFNLNPING
jgi:hypothetical protein